MITIKQKQFYSCNRSMEITPEKLENLKCDYVKDRLQIFTKMNDNDKIAFAEIVRSITLERVEKYINEHSKYGEVTEICAVKIGAYYIWVIPDLIDFISNLQDGWSYEKEFQPHHISNCYVNNKEWDMIWERDHKEPYYEELTKR